MKFYNIFPDTLPPRQDKMSHVQLKTFISADESAATTDSDKPAGASVCVSDTNSDTMDGPIDNGTEVSEFELLLLSSDTNNNNHAKSNTPSSSNTPTLEKEIKITHTFLENYKDSELNDILPKNYRDKRFVLLDVQTPCSDPLYETVAWVFTIDKSGSMGWACSDGKTKMDHLKQTFENMIGYFIDISYKFGINQTITILTFNDTTSVVCKDVPITAEFFRDFKTTIDEKFRPSGGTDINSALSFVKEHIICHPIFNGSAESCESKSQQQQPQHDNSLIVHIFMSDGEVTTGVTNPTTMKAKVVNDHRVYNSFIGFGEDHDSELMKVLASGSWSDYFYVKGLDQSSSVYAEAIYNGIYQYVKNIKVTVEDDTALIYDFDKNSWNDSLTVDSIQSGSTKNFHITVANYNPSINIMIEYELSGKSVKVNSIPKSESIGKIDIEAYKYLWRQETLDLLFDIENYNSSPEYGFGALRGVRRYYGRRRDNDFDTVFPDTYGGISDEEEEDEEDDEEKVGSETALLAANPPQPVDGKVSCDTDGAVDDERADVDLSDLTTPPRKNRCCSNIFDFAYVYAEYEYSRNDKVVEQAQVEQAQVEQAQVEQAQVEQKGQKRSKVRVKKPSRIDNLNVRIETYLEETQSFIEKYDLSEDEFMKQLVSTVTSSKKTLMNNNHRTRSDNYSRRLTLGRQRSHSIGDHDSELQSNTSCFRNGTLDDIILRVSSDAAKL